MNDEPWYSAKCVFRHRAYHPGDGQSVYEERVVLLRADSIDEAIAKAEAFAERYAAENDCDYLGYLNTYHLFEDMIGDGAEVYSLMYTSRLDAEEFITHYFDDGTQHQQESQD